MAQGRCVGCGLVKNSSRDMRRHILGCPDYLSIFKQDPTRALLPEDEYARWKSAEGSDEALAAQQRAEREAKLAARIAENARKVQTQHSRWATPPDPLAD